MTESPRMAHPIASKSAKTAKKISAKKGPYPTGAISNSTSSSNKKAAQRRFSILSNQSSDISSSSSSDDDDDDNDESDSTYDDVHARNKHRQIANKKAMGMAMPHMNNNNNSSGSDDDYSSSSDDENVDFVQLTKQRRMKAMKAVKGLKKQMTTNSQSPGNSASGSPFDSPSLVEQEEPELDDDLVDAVIESEERRMRDLNDDENTPNASNVNDYSDADLNDDLGDIDFEFSFDDDDEDNDADAGDSKQKHKNEKSNAKQKDFKNVLEKLRDEDLGEAVPVDDSTLKNATGKIDNKDDNIIHKPELIDVPKLDEKEINSDADYEFDNDDLIQTLMKDNDDLELQNMDNSDDDDFDYLIANQHNIDQDAVNKSNNTKDLTMDNSLNNADSAYLMKEETQAMLDDFERTPKINAFKNRRSSMFYHQAYNNEQQQDLDDLDLDLLNNFEQFLPKQQAMRRRSSILNQTLLSSDDDDDDDESAMNIDSITKHSKKSRKSQMKSRKSNNGGSTSGNNSTHARNIRSMLGISNADSNFTSKFSSNAIVDSDDDTKLLEYIFEDSESEDASNVAPGDKSSHSNMAPDGNETDEDENLPKKSTKNFGSKHAKEILSSNKDQFRAPKLGTFITNKPYSIIDGFTTRFLQPLHGNQSMMQKAAALNSTSSNPNSASVAAAAANYNIALDELLNISEFDEDSNIDQDDEMDTYFGDKNIPLTAFRNKTLHGNGGTDIPSNRRFSFTDRTHRRKHHKSSKSKSKATKLSNKPSSTSTSLSQFKFKTQPQASNNAPTDVSASELIIDPTSVDEVLLIGVESLPLPLGEHMMDGNEINFEIAAPGAGSSRSTAARKRKSMSRQSKARFRRASMVEAQAEGLRQTKNGLFDENVIDDVEALLIDMGDTEEYEFLFGTLM